MLSPEAPPEGSNLDAGSETPCSAGVEPAVPAVGRAIIPEQVSGSEGPVKYYQPEHRTGYAEIERRGLSCWNELHGESGFVFSLHSFLDRVLLDMTFASDRPRALEYGCGTGACCCYLAERGFEVDGLDVEPKAIQLAQQIASDRGHSINYQIADICDHDGPREEFDLIVDGYCLQCIVLENDRQGVFAAVRSMLRYEGYFVIGTAIWDPGRDYGGDPVDRVEGISYGPLTGDPGEYESAEMIDGSWHLPNRRHRTPPQLLNEVVSAGFEVLEQDGGQLLCRLQR